MHTIAVAAALTVAGAAQASIQVFEDETSFLAALSSFGTDTFDDLIPGAATEGPLARSAGAVGYTVTASPNSPILYGAGTAADPWLSTNNARDFITFSGFSLPVLAIGAYVSGSDIAGLPLAGGLSAVRLTTGDGRTVEFARRAAADNYWGFLSDSPIVSFEVKTFFSRRADPVWPTVDDLTVAAVPEPGIYAMLLAGLAVVGFIAGRRGAGG
ncbi:MAG: hypothetical protein Fur0014_05220 [Rubrivivax sp.]